MAKSRSSIIKQVPADKKYRKDKPSWQKDLGYDYPGDIDLRVGSKIHDKLVEDAIRCVGLSTSLIDERVSSEWDDLEWSQQAFMEKTEAEQLLKKRGIRRPVAVVLPWLGALNDLHASYMMSAFGTNPITRYKGLAGKASWIASGLYELLVGRQATWFGHLIQLDQLFRDGNVYGRGTMAVMWDKVKASRSEIVEVDDILAEMAERILGDKSIHPGDSVLLARDSVVCEGSRLETIAPRQLLWDPKVPAREINRSEWIGFIERKDIQTLLRREEDPEWNLFNVRNGLELVRGGTATSTYYQEGKTQVRTGQDQSTNEIGTTNHPVDVINLYRDVIPSEYDLADSDQPVRLLLRILGDKILVSMHVVDFEHGQWPFISWVPDNSRDVLPTSLMMRAYPAQQCLDWEINTRLANAAWVMNGITVIDPRYVYAEDVMHPEPGKVIRLREDAFMSGPMAIQNVIQQLDVKEFTGNKMSEAMVFMSIMGKLLGLEEIMSGNLAGLPERPGQAGIALAQAGSTSRLKRAAQLAHEQVMRPLGMQLMFNTHQFLGEGAELEIAGRRKEQLQQLMGLQPQNGIEPSYVVRREDLSNMVEVEAQSPTFGANPNAAVMTEIFKVMLSVEGVAQQLAQEMQRNKISPLTILSHYARIVGDEQFAAALAQENTSPVRAQVLPDDVIRDRVESGKMLPLEEVGRE